MAYTSGARVGHTRCLIETSLPKRATGKVGGSLKSLRLNRAPDCARASTNARCTAANEYDVSNDRSWRGVQAHGLRLSTWFARLCRRAGLHNRSIQGLRHTRGRSLVDAECTPHEIGEAVGMSLAIVSHYTRSASQADLADRATERLGQKTRTKFTPSYVLPQPTTA